MKLREFLALVVVAGVLTPAAGNPFDDLKRKAQDAVRDGLKDVVPVPKQPLEPVKSPVPAPAKSGPNPVANPAAAWRAPHLHPLKTFTSSAEIVPVQLPVVGTTPVIGYSLFFPGQNHERGLSQWLGDANAIRWLLLMQIAQRPAVLEQPMFARRIALLFLPPSQWDTYLECISAHAGQPKDCNHDLEVNAKASVNRGRPTESYMLEGLVRDWKGSNEFDKPRSHRAFVESYGPILRAQATKLPQEVLLFSSLSLHQPYKDGMLPTTDRAGNFLGFNGGAKETLPIIGGYCATTAVRWPKGIVASPDEAEALLNRLGANRQAYVALRVKLSRVDAEGSFGSVNPIGTPAYTGCKVEAQVIGLAMYKDPALGEKLLDLPVSGGGQRTP